MCNRLRAIRLWPRSAMGAVIDTSVMPDVAMVLRHDSADPGMSLEDCRQVLRDLMELAYILDQELSQTQ